MPANVYDTIPGDTAVDEAPPEKANPYDSIPENPYDAIPATDSQPPSDLLAPPSIRKIATTSPTTSGGPPLSLPDHFSTGLEAADLTDPFTHPGIFTNPESVPIPKLTDSLPQPTTTSGKLAVGAAKGTEELARGIADFFTSGPGISQIGAAATPLAPVVYAKWAYDMAKTAIESGKQSIKDFNSADWEGLGKNLVTTAGSVLGALGAGGHGVKILSKTAEGFVPRGTGIESGRPTVPIPPPTTGEPNASREPTTTQVGIRSQGQEVGGSAPLRQQGQAAGESQPVKPVIQTEAQGNAVKLATPEDLAARNPGEISHTEIAALKPLEAEQLFSAQSKKGLANQVDGVTAGLKLKPEDVEELEGLRDAAEKERVKLGDAGDFGKAYTGLTGKVTWLNGAIEGAKRKGPNYDLVAGKGEPVPNESMEEFKAKEDARKAKETADLKARGYDEFSRNKMTPEEKAAAIAKPIPSLEADAARWHELNDAIKAEKDPIKKMELYKQFSQEVELIKNRNTKNPGNPPERPPKPAPAPKPDLAALKKEFTDLVHEHGDLFLEQFDLERYSSGVKNLGKGNPAAKVQLDKYVSMVHKTILKRLGLHNEGEIKTAGVLGKALPKLKSFIQDHLAKEGMTAEIPPDASTDFLPPGEAEPEMVGMGGAVPKEFERNPETATGIKNATVDAERAKRGLPAAMAPAKRTFGEVWDAAMAKIDREPDWLDGVFDSSGKQLKEGLLSELRNKPRALTDLEDAALLHRQIDLQNEYGKATRDLAQAHADGRTDAVLEEKERVETLRDQLYDLYEISKKSGTETGRGLNARKMMAFEDFSLAKMELEKRAIANGGAPLSEAQAAEIKALHEEIAAKQKAYDDYVQKTEVRDAERVVKEALDKVEREAKAPKASSYVIQLAEKWVAKQDIRADAARKRLRERLGRTSAGVDPTILTDLAEIGASHLGHIGLDFAKWSEKILGDVGDFVKPHLQEVFDASRAIWEKSGAPTAVKKTVLKVKDMTGEQRKADLSNKIRDKFDQGKKNEVATLVRKLARQFVEDGISDRNELIDAVHGVLKEIQPEMTRREAMDAISGYGEFKMLSQEEVNVTLRDLKRQMQNVAKLDDMLSGKPPLKTGLQLTDESPSQELRRLVAEVNKAKNEFQVPVTDSLRQLKSALDTVKTRLANRITDYETKLANKDFEPRKRNVVKLDPEALRLKAAAESAKLKYMRSLELDRLSKRSRTEKVLEQIAGAARASALSGYHTLAKLASFTAARLGEIPLNEAVGAAISKIPGFRRIFAGANMESGATLKALGKFYGDFATKGMRQAAEIMRKGESGDKIIYGKPDLRPPRWFDFFNRMHGAEKAPLRVGSQSMYYTRAYENAIKAGLDVNNEFVKAQINKEAYDYSQSSILQENNKFAEMVNAGLRRLEQKNPKTGKVELQNVAIANLFRTLVTKGIIRTPANYFAQTIARTPIGLSAGLVKTAHAHFKGIENLHPVEKDAIAKLVKVGAVGSAFFLWGMIDATQDEKNRVFGGYYSPGRKKTGPDVPWGKLRIDGVTLPHIATHNPLTENAQMGSTLMRVFIARSKKGDDGSTAALEGGVKSLVGLVSKAPIANPLMRLDSTGNKVVGGLLQGLVPQLVQNIAEDTDLGKDGLVERAPKSAFDQIAVGVPGLRQTVKEKKK